jgi:CRISPR/Cas system-associated protein Cas5 (RAMP superfamily)
VCFLFIFLKINGISLQPNLSNILESFIGNNQLALVGMPEDVRNIFLRAVGHTDEEGSDENKAPLTKEEVKVLRIYAKKRLIEAKKIEKVNRKEERNLKKMRKRMEKIKGKKSENEMEKEITEKKDETLLDFSTPALGSRR